MDRTSISMQQALFKDGGITLKIHTSANLEIFKAMIAFLQFLMDTVGSNVHSFAKTT